MLRMTKAAPKMTPRDYFVRKARTSKDGKDALTKLNDYLNANTAAPMYWLHNMWTNQKNAITYKELREAIQNGYIDEATLRAWQQDYANFVTVHLAPSWEQAAAAGAAAVAAKATGGWIFDAMGDGMTSWISAHGAEFITAISDDSREAIRALIGAAATGQYTVDELAGAIRPLVGLTKQQSAANLKYYTTVRDDLLKNNPNMKQATAEKRARDAAMKYAERQHRQRAYTIATTEMAFAHNYGYLECIRQARAAGYIGDGFLAVDTAADDDICPMCAAMEGKQIDIDKPVDRHLFAGQAMIPPFHPRCRCATHFVETSPPVFQPQQAPQDNGMPSPQSASAAHRTVRQPTDVTNSYIVNAKPGQGRIRQDPGYDTNRHKDETTTAKWILNTFGGNITLLTEEKKCNIKMPDYFWRGAFWELKNPNSIKATDSALRHAIHQIEAQPGGVILDYKNNLLLDSGDQRKVEEIVTYRTNRSAVFMMDVMILSNGELLKVLRYERKEPSTARNGGEAKETTAPPPN